MNTYVHRKPGTSISIAALFVNSLKLETTQMNKQMAKQTGIFIQQNIAK